MITVTPRKVREKTNAAKAIRQGDVVEVFKGRKAPKGRYIVERIGENSYGDFLHLKHEETGDLVKFINPDNARSTRQPVFGQVQQMVATAMERGDEGVLVLADWLDEQGSGVARYLRNWVRAGRPIVPAARVAETV